MEIFKIPLSITGVVRLLLLSVYRIDIYIYNFDGTVLIFFIYYILLLFFVSVVYCSVIIFYIIIENFSCLFIIIIFIAYMV